MVCTALHITFNILGEWMSLTVTGDRPPPMNCFTLTSITNDTSILFGGAISNGNSNDVYVFQFTETSVVSAIICCMTKECKLLSAIEYYF